MALGLAASGCTTTGASDEDPSSCEPADPTDLGDCTPYTPATIAGSQDHVWTSAEDALVIPVEVDDPGGGLVEVTLAIGDVPVTSLVRRPGASAEEVHYGADVGFHGEKTGAFVFRAQGRESYEIAIHPLLDSVDADASITVSWSYAPNVDCYEDNDSPAAARRIPLDVAIDAYAHAGIIAGDGILVGRSMADYYTFELTQPTEVRLAVRKPSDEAIVFELWDPATEYGIVGIDLFASGGTLTRSDAVLLEPGTHYVRVGHFVSQLSTHVLDSPIPASWNQPYTLTVERVGVEDGETGERVVCAAPEPAPVADHECVAYTPATVGGTQSGTWTAIDQFIDIPLDITDPGGGLVEVTVTVGDTPTSAGVRRWGAPAEDYTSGVLVSGDGSEDSFVFRAQGHERYALQVGSFTSPAGNGNDGYTVTWSYLPLVDCYEQNQTAAEARRIPLDTPITAYAHAGIGPGDVVLVSSTMVDFYRFVLDAPTTVRLGVTKPSDEAIAFELWDVALDYRILGTDIFAPGGVMTYSDEIMLEAGTHYVRVGPTASQNASQSLDEPLPGSWTDPYTLVVEAR